MSSRNEQFDKKSSNNKVNFEEFTLNGLLRRLIKPKLTWQTPSADQGVVENPEP